MKFVASAGIGLLLSVLLIAIPMVLAFIPGVGAVVNICRCLLWPGLSAVAGYAAASVAGVRKEDWSGLATEMAVLALSFAVVSLVLQILSAVLGLGINVATGSNAVGAAFLAGMGIISAVCSIVMSFGITFVAALIGGAICLATKK
ncbi:MAG: hypothetical protein QXU54_00215 [Candidatus Micrarchaeia archaeon]